MKAAGLLLVLISAMYVPHLEAVFATDIVQITGSAYDAEGKPVTGVTVEAWSLTPPWVSYGRAKTDSMGGYVLSFDRPKRLVSPAKDSYGGFPVYEGCKVNVAYPSMQWMPVTDRAVSYTHLTLPTKRIV